MNGEVNTTLLPCCSYDHRRALYGNPKSEILNSKQIPITKFQNSKHVLDLGHLDFEFV